LVLAEVAIKENESSGGDVATSFKEFADANLDSPSAASIVSGLSIFTNTCILVFGLNRAGDVGSSMLGGALDPTMCMFGFAAVLGALPITQSRENVSKISSMIVMALFASFFGLLVPGLANVQDPVGTFFSPGTCESGISETAPIILMSMVYQNIVPTVTKILDYDRDKSFAAIALGSFLPLCLYLAWSFACIGGGVDMNAVGASGALMTVFSVTATIGSSIGCAMAIPEEVGFFLPSNDKSNDEDNNGLANPVAVAVGVGIPAAIAYMFAGGDDLTMAFKIAGSYGTPLLYGVIPAAMAWTQRKRLEDIPNLVPGGVATLAGLGLASMCLVMQELSIDVGAFLS
jgi:tyrosine-specific transport protein